MHATIFSLPFASCICLIVFFFICVIQKGRLVLNMCTREFKYVRESVFYSKQNTLTTLPTACNYRYHSFENKNTKLILFV